MAVTIVVLSGGVPSLPELSLTLDSPRVVIGRGEGCEVRLPDPSVSARHASLRQRGGEYVVLDESSRNGTFLGPVRLPPQTPRAVRHGERIRVGRVWLEVRIEPAVVKGSTAAAARELALSLVSRGLASQGEDPGPRLTVLEGPEAGQTLPVAEAGVRWALARDPDADLPLSDPALAKRRIEIARRGDALVLRDLGAGPPLLLDEAVIGADEATWRAGQTLRIGKTLVAYDYPAAVALAEIERSPDEAMADDEAPSPPAGAVTDDDAEPEAPAPPNDATPTPAPIAAAAARNPRKAAADTSSWGVLDSVVVLLAIGVLTLSLLGAWWLLGR